MQDEENQQLSKLDLCRKAGFAFAGPWYTAIKDPEFRAAVKTLYMEAERQRGCSAAPVPRQPPEWTKAQQILLDLLQDEANHQLNISELCQKAGFPNLGHWYRAIADLQFRAALEDLGVTIQRGPSKQNQRPDGPKWGKNHQLLLDLLQVEENRHLSIIALCQKAGFASKKAWYRALEHPEFRTAVEALGVEIVRNGIYAKPKETRSIPQWSSLHQTLLDLLQIDANRHLSITALCEEAGFADRTYWYRALKHPEFKAAVEALGIELERYELRARGPTKAERKILQVLQDVANRQLPIVEVCRRAGYSDDYWYKSLKSADFVQALEALGVPVKRRERNENGWTEVQQNLLDVLQDPANHALSITALCQAAGYPNCTYWFRALKSQRFIAAIEAIGFEIWWNGRNQQGLTRAQQRFLNFLQETPSTTAAELCRRAGYTGTSAWTMVIQDPHFLATLNSLGISVERIARRTDGWTWGQKRLVEVLQDEENRERSIVEVCRLAGYSNHLWYGALQRPEVLAEIKRLNVQIARCGPDEEGWTRAQRRLLDVLHDGKNRTLSIIELCAKAGYSDLGRWYESLSSAQFVETLQAWDVPIARQKPPFTPHIYVRLTMSLEADLNKDVWDIRRFKPDYPKHRHPSAYILDFTWISNPSLRQQVKHYLRQHLPRWRAATFGAQLWCLKGVLSRLPTEVDIATITRAHIEELLPSFLAESSDSWAKSSLGATKAMLLYMAHSATWNGPRPANNLIDREDIPSPQTPLPRPIPLEVLDQLDSLLELAIQFMCTDDLLPPLMG